MSTASAMRRPQAVPPTFFGVEAAVGAAFALAAAYLEIDRIRHGAVEARIASAVASGLPVFEPGGLVALALSDGAIRAAKGDAA